MDKGLAENEKKKQFLNSYLQSKMDVIRLEEQLAELRINKLSPSANYDELLYGYVMKDLSDYMVQVEATVCDRAIGTRCTAYPGGRSGGAFRSQHN